jgi:hypothetical protein
MGDLLKYIARPTMSVTTFTIWIGDIAFIGYDPCRKLRHPLPVFQLNSESFHRSASGGMSGSSPCTLTTISAPEFSTAAATRSLPLGKEGSVRTALPPNDLTLSIMRSSSVATKIFPTKPGLFYLLINSLYHRFAVEIDKRFTG